MPERTAAERRVTPDRPPAELRRHGLDAVSFQAVESGLHWWRDDEPPVGTGAVLAYADTGGAWIGVGRPLTTPDRRAAATRRFLADARAAGRRGALFGIETPAGVDARTLDERTLNLPTVNAPSLTAPALDALTLDPLTLDAPPLDARPLETRPLEALPLEATADAPAPRDELRRLPLGRQSILLPSRWPDSLRVKPRLREQLRRARAKGVTVRRLTADDLAAETPTRRRIDQLCRLWLGSRRMEPMHFLVSVEPFHYPDEHIYLVAERDGRIVQFLSAVPIYARRGWLMEDMLRAPEAPNGTTELLLDRLFHEARTNDHSRVFDEAPARTALSPLAETPAVDDEQEDETFITPGLTPLAGAIPWWLRLARDVSRPLYDFAGLERFRARLAPPRWDTVWLVWDRGPAPRVLLDVLAAFAGGSLTRFAWRTFTRHPSAPPWGLALPLLPWSLLLACLVLLGRADLLGFSALALAGWVLFDAALAWLLFRAAHRPHPARLATAAACAGLDAALSVQHLLDVGFGPSAVSTLLRFLATAAPIAGCGALVWALRRATAARSAD